MSHKINASSAGLKQTVDGTKPANHMELAVDGTTIVTVTPEGLVFDVGTGGGGGSTGPAFSAYHSGNNPQATNSTNFKVLFPTEVFDTDSKFTGNRFIPQDLGLYQFNWRVKIQTMSSGTYFVTKLYKNGTLLVNGDVTFSPQASSKDLSSGGSYIAQVTAPTDYFEIFIFQGDTVPKTIIGGETETFFNGHFVRSI